MIQNDLSQQLIYLRTNNCFMNIRDLCEVAKNVHGKITFVINNGMKSLA